MQHDPHNDWVRVAALDALVPGAVAAAAGEAGLVVALLDETAYVAAAACPACGDSLAGGRVDGGELHCPCGRRSFPMPGDSDAAPAEPEGPRRYAALVVDEDVYAHVPE